MLNSRITQDSVIYSVDHKGFKIRSYCEDPLNPFGDTIFSIKKAGYEERTRDEHGRLNLIWHDAETFDFTISQIEFLRETDPPEIVIINRFKAEVDYYLKKKSDIIEDNFISVVTRKYICPCCGTDFVTSKEGYTPKCENCGALMKLEAFNGVEQ